MTHSLWSFVVLFLESFKFLFYKFSLQITSIIILRKDPMDENERRTDFMKYVILGGVAAGTKAGAKLKRCDRSAEVKD